MIYTPENRKQFPEFVGVIVRKNKPDMIIDVGDVKDVIEALNSNDFVRIENYATSIHKFDIEEITKRKTKDNERTMILKMLKGKEEIKNSLSLTQSIEGLQKNFLN